MARLGFGASPLHEYESRHGDTHEHSKCHQSDLGQVNTDAVVASTAAATGGGGRDSCVWGVWIRMRSYDSRR